YATVSPRSVCLTSSASFCSTNATVLIYPLICERFQGAIRTVFAVGSTNFAPFLDLKFRVDGFLSRERQVVQGRQLGTVRGEDAAHVEIAGQDGPALHSAQVRLDLRPDALLFLRRERRRGLLGQ